MHAASLCQPRDVASAALLMSSSSSSNMYKQAAPAIISYFSAEHPQGVARVSQHSHILRLQRAHNVVAQQLVLVGVCGAK
jgi:hypothetical protein